MKLGLFISRGRVELSLLPLRERLEQEKKHYIDPENEMAQSNIWSVGTLDPTSGVAASSGITEPHKLLDHQLVFYKFQQFRTRCILLSIT